MSEDPKAIGREIDGLRDELSAILGELDRRRRELLDWRTQLRKNAVPIAIAAAGLVAIGGGAVAWAIHRRELASRPSEKRRRFKQAMDRAMRHPERVAGGKPHPASSIGWKILTAAGSAVATMLVRRIGEEIYASARTDAVRKKAVPAAREPDVPSALVVT